ncbi:hypothetical protein P280DRAFT_474084 [Massarina eburnea CBS 473.64]|uniref:Jacalin-type lectin domain-containing protein n=1 Tax=Massarina eburnea CBS 473.64 TaxID=1395130 RepID=A0A6A6RM54_9PLEO|nr:hypothetical protein P280DRAFT_474084 [Massarina eburnea CBS 473.64]
MHIPSLLPILSLTLSTLLPPVSADLGDRAQCEKHGLNKAAEKGFGSPSGEYFCSSKIKSGIVINGLECWADSKSVRGLKFYYSDLSTMMIGKAGGSGRVANDKAMWDPTADHVTALSLWGGGWNGILGRVDMRVSNGQYVNCGKDTTFGAADFETDLGAGGMMIGASGGFGDGIDNVAFQFSATALSRVTLTSLDVPAIRNLGSDPSTNGLTNMNFETIRIINRQKSDSLKTTNFKWSKSMKKSRTWNFEETNSFSFGQNFGVSLAIPEGPEVKSETSYEWKSTTTESKQNVDEVEEAVHWTIPELSIKPGKAKSIKIVAVQGELDSAKYKAMMKVTFKDSSTLDYETVATFGTLGYGTMDVIVEDEDAEDAMKEVGRSGSVELDKDGNRVAKSKRYVGFVA